MELGRTVNRPKDGFDDEKRKSGVKSSSILQVSSFLQARASDLELLTAQQRKALSERAAKRSSATTARGAERAEYNVATEEVRHLRRRTRSYRSYVVPRKLRQGGALANSQDGPEGSPNRAKKRMRRTKLCEDKSSWSNTHLWSVKRMKMTRGPDGRSAAQEPRDKGLDFVLRRARHGCTVVDLSTAAACLQVEFKAKNIESGASVERAECELGTFLSTIGARDLISLAYTDGRRAGTISEVHWEKGRNESRSIGPLRFLWQPIADSRDDLLFSGKLILICDPRCKKEMVACLTDRDFDWVAIDTADHAGQVDTFRLRGEQTHLVFSLAFGKTCCADPFWVQGVVGGILRTPDALAQGVGLALSLDAQEVASSFANAPLPPTTTFDFAALRRLQIQWNRQGCPSSMNLGEAFGDIIRHEKDVDDGDNVPLLFIRSESNAWDLLLPKSLTKALWLRIVHAGATASGLKNEAVAAIEKGQRLFPQDYPGAIAYDEYWRNLETLHAQERARRPLSKQVAFPWPLTPGFPCARRGELVCVSLALCHSQPRGAKARLETCAKLYMPLKQDSFKVPIHVATEREPLGFVTSCLTLTHHGAVGTAFCLLSVLEGSVQGRALMSARKKRSMMVLVRNRKPDNGKSIYCTGMIQVL